MTTLRRILDANVRRFDDNETTAIPGEDCRTPTESEAQSQNVPPKIQTSNCDPFADSDRETPRDPAPYDERIVSEFGVISKGRQANLICDVEICCRSASQVLVLLQQGSDMGSVNFAKASGQDKTEQWLLDTVN